MALSTAARLTQQFYEWERRGRGWHKADFSVDLEPPFAPFFGHFLPDGPIIDDGKRPSFFQSLFGTAPATDGLPQGKEEDEIRAYPCADDGPLTIFSIAIPKSRAAHAEQMEQLLVMLLYRNSPVSFEVIATEDEITFQLACRDAEARYVETQARAFFPDFGIQETFDDAIEALLRAELCLYTVDFGLADEFMRPMAQLAGGKECFLPLFGIFDRLQGDEGVILQVLFSGVQHSWADQMLNAVYDNDGKSPFFFDEPDMVRLAEEKASRPICAATVRVMTFADTLPGAHALLDHAATAILHGSKGAGNSLLPLPDAAYTVHERMADVLMRESRRVGMLLNSRELASLAHFPLAPLRKLALQRNTKEVPPSLVGHEYCIGMNVHHGNEKEVTLSTEQRSRHVHVIGSTGTGKSVLLHSLMMEDTRLGNGFMCIDPHGDLIDALLGSIPKERIKDVVLIDPSDSEFPVGFNVLSAHSELERELLASDLVALFRRFSTSWGDQMNSVLANAILAFLYNSKGGTLADLRRFLVEAPFRNSILAGVTDPDIAYYWRSEYPLLKGGSIGPILTRLDGFLRPRVIRNMVCQRASLDFAALMDGKKIVLVKLSHGLLGAENSYLLGALIVSKLQQVAMSRQAQARESRVPFYCYIDEFHLFTTPSMAEILSGTRKYGLGLVLAHQDMQQVQKHDRDVASSLLSAGTRICLRLNDTDARQLQEGFASFGAEDLQNLSTGEGIVRANTAANDCTISVVPYEHDGGSHKEAIIEHSRGAYGAGAPPHASEPMSAAATASEEAPAPRVEPEKGPANAQEAQPREKVREHRYLQALIKKLAEDMGYKAQLEVKTPDGSGQVDVLLEKNDARLAVEISVTTTAEWELHNVQKCLAAGYDAAIVCSTDAKKRRSIQQLIEGAMSQGEASRIHVVSPDAIRGLLAPMQERPKDETVMKGYRIKVQYGEKTGSDQIIQRIINAAKKP